MSKYIIFTDGSSRGNPGPAGWGMLVMNEDYTQIIHQYSAKVDSATNNQMELSAVLYALQYADEHPQDIFVIYSDSAYVVNSCNSWIHSWARNGWRNSKNQIVENIAFMQEIYRYLTKEFFNADICKCSGHTGELGNELADALATGNSKKYKEILDGWDIDLT